MPLDLYIAYVFACFLMTIVPGPTVTLIVANSLQHGTRAGVLNAIGTQIGFAVWMGTVMVGLASVISALGWWFELLRYAGAAYLLWIGYKLVRYPDAIAQAGAAPAPRGGFVLQGCLVLLANPKAFFFFIAFIPQFIDPRGDYIAQIVLLGITAMVAALLTDGAYAVFTGRAGRALSRRHVRLVSRASGGFLIGGGIWLALTRAR